MGEHRKESPNAREEACVSFSVKTKTGCLNDNEHRTPWEVACGEVCDLLHVQPMTLLHVVRNTKIKGNTLTMHSALGRVDVRAGARKSMQLAVATSTA